MILILINRLKGCWISNSSTSCGSVVLNFVMSIIHTIEEIDATWNENLNKKTMKLKKYRIDDIADLNRSCISKIDTISDIEYLDTSNITENVIFDTYMLNIK